MRQQKSSTTQPKNKKTALVQAVDLLARQAHSTRKLADKLKQREYEEAEITAAVDRLTQRGYLNDAELCQRQFERYFAQGHDSIKAICYKLRNKGFSESLVRSCIPEESAEREQAAALCTLQRKFKPDAPPQKMQQYLYTRGFASGAIRRAVEDFQCANEMK